MPSTPIVSQSDIILRQFGGKYLAKATPMPSAENVEWVEYTFTNAVGIDILDEGAVVADQIAEHEHSELASLTDSFNQKQYELGEGDTLRMAAKEFILPRRDIERECYRYCWDPLTKQMQLVVLWGVFDVVYGPPIRPIGERSDSGVAGLSSIQSNLPPATPSSGPTSQDAALPPTNGSGWNHTGWIAIVLVALGIILLMLLLHSCINGNQQRNHAPKLPRVSDSSNSGIAPSPEKSPVINGNNSPELSDGDKSIEPRQAHSDLVSSSLLSSKAMEVDSLAGDRVDQTNKRDGLNGRGYNISSGAGKNSIASEETAISSIEINESGILTASTVSDMSGRSINVANTANPNIGHDSLSTGIDGSDGTGDLKMKHEWKQIDGPPLVENPGQNRLPPDILPSSLTSDYVKVRLNHRVIDENGFEIINQDIEWVYERK